MVANGDMVFRTFLSIRTSDFAHRRLPVAKQVFYDTLHQLRRFSNLLLVQMAAGDTTVGSIPRPSERQMIDRVASHSGPHRRPARGSA